MANPEHLAVLRQGREIWNSWREQASEQSPDLSEADLSGADLSGANLAGANLSRANLSEVNLSEANLEEANLEGANLAEINLSQANLEGANLAQTVAMRMTLLQDDTVSTANLSRANLSMATLSDARLLMANLKDANLSDANLLGADLPAADLSGADLSNAILEGAILSNANLSDANLSKAFLGEANLSGTNLSRARLNGADLSQSILVGTNFSGAELNGARVYGVSVWDVVLAGTKQHDLVITRKDEAEVTVDNLEVAQFIYLLLNNTHVRDVIDTVAKKAVLILGRFSSKRKAVLDKVRVALRSKGYVPIVFDFEKPASKDLTGTIQTLAHLSRFVIADLTDPRSVPHELMAFVPNTIVPVMPVILSSQDPYAMLGDLRRRYHWLLTPFQYDTTHQLITELDSSVIVPAELKAKELFGESA